MRMRSLSSVLATTKGRRFTIALTAGALFALGAQLAAQKPAATPPGAQAAKSKAGKQTPAATPGMRVFKDPVTGQFREPDAEEAAALNPAPSQPVPGQPNLVFRARGGGDAVQLDESTMAFSVAKIGPDGKLSYECVTGEAAAKKALKTPPAPASVQKRSTLEEK